MQKQVMGTAVAAIFATAMVGAQTTAPQDQRSGSAATQQSVTLEGCLQQGDRASADAAGAAGAASMSDAAFVLQNARVATGSESSAASAEGAPAAPQSDRTSTETARAEPQADTPVGTSGVAGSAAAAASYKVIGLDKDRLKEFDGKRVRVMGKFEDRAAASPGASAAGADRTDADRPQPDATGAATTPPAGTTGTGVAGHAGTAGAGASASDHRSMGDGHMKEFRATSIEAASGSCPPASR